MDSKQLNVVVDIVAVTRNGYNLRKVKTQTPELCMAAVMQCGIALQYVKWTLRTKEICEVAVANSGYALAHVIEQTPELCLIAVNRHGMALKCVREQTHELCLAAVTENGLALRYVLTQTEEICIIALSKDRLALQYVKEVSPKLRHLLRKNKVEHPPLTIYKMCYCDCTYESALVTISLHRTKFGALRAMLVHKQEIQAEWDERRFKYGKRFNKGEKPFGAMAWDIIEAEAQD